MSALRNGALTGETGNWRVGAHSRCSVRVNLIHKPSQTGRHTPKRSSPPGEPGGAWPGDHVNGQGGPPVALLLDPVGPRWLGRATHLESHLFTQSAERWGSAFLRADGEAAARLCPGPFIWVERGLGHVFVLQGVPETRQVMNCPGRVLSTGELGNHRVPFGLFTP